MSDYEARITENKDGSFEAMVVRVDDDGYVNVTRYGARNFKTRAAAEKSTAAYIAKLNA